MFLLSVRLCCVACVSPVVFTCFCVTVTAHLLLSLCSIRVFHLIFIVCVSQCVSLCCISVVFRNLCCWAVVVADVVAVCVLVCCCVGLVRMCLGCSFHAVALQTGNTGNNTTQTIRRATATTASIASTATTSTATAKANVEAQCLHPTVTLRLSCAASR